MIGIDCALQHLIRCCAELRLETSYHRGTPLEAELRAILAELGREKERLQAILVRPRGEVAP